MEITRKKDYNQTIVGKERTSYEKLSKNYKYYEGTHLG